MLLNQIEVPARGKLEDWRANLWGAWGADCLLGGQPWCLRQASGSALDLVPFRGPAVNAGFLTAFGSSVAVQLCNQNPAQPARFLSNGFVTSLPLAVSGGAFLGLLQFDGANDEVATTDTFGPTSGATVFFRGRLRALQLGIIVEHSANYNSSDAWVIYYDNAINCLVVGSHQNTGALYAKSEFNVTATTEAVFCARIDRTQTTGAAQCVLFVNGTKQTRASAGGETSPVPSSNFTAAGISVGARYNLTVWSQLDLKSLAVYSVALSDADCATISGLL